MIAASPTLRAREHQTLAAAADALAAVLAADVQRHAETAFALLDHGLADYAPR